jgi:hypothetical protein
MSAPNPWFKESRELEISGILYDGEDPLEMIREFVLNWPGEETVKLDHVKRHDRLTQIIAGYPEIDVGRYPLDWPLSSKAAKSLRLTRYLDSIKSPDGKTSLRSALINKSHQMKLHFSKIYDMYVSEAESSEEEIISSEEFENNNEKTFQAAHRRFVAILLLALRAHGGEQSNHSLSGQEHKLLTSLHSNSQQRMIPFWPIIEIKRTINQDFGHWNSENYLPKIPKSHLPGEFCQGWLNYDDISTVLVGKRISVKMQFIQSWIENWSDKFQKWNDGASLIRGSSAILESVMSSLRSSIIDNYGVESILVDGGGRVEFIGDDDAEQKLLESFFDVFIISRKQEPYFNNEIELIARTLSGKSSSEKTMASDFGLIYGIESESWEDLDYRNGKIRNWVEKHLPKLSMKVDGEIKQNSDAFESIIGSESCCICIEDVPVKGNMFNRQKQISDNKKPYCTFHRLLYQIGNAQRMIDSTTKEEGVPHAFTTERQRTVNGIARLDLNSLGILFTRKFDGEKENNNDITRRRSIRFNSQWWGIVNRVLDNKNLNIDQIVAWVAAGDDIILADYIPVNSNPTPKLLKTLQNLALGLHELSKQEYGPFELTFGAGLSTKDMDENIIKMMGRAKDAEIIAKNIWKQNIDDDLHKNWMIINCDGEKKSYTKENVDKGDINDYNGSIVYIFPGD